MFSIICATIFNFRKIKFNRCGYGRALARVKGHKLELKELAAAPRHESREDKRRHRANGREKCRLSYSNRFNYFSIILAILLRRPPRLHMAKIKWINPNVKRLQLFPGSIPIDSIYFRLPFGRMTEFFPSFFLLSLGRRVAWPATRRLGERVSVPEPEIKRFHRDAIAPWTTLYCCS